ncbi:MAG: hypothetical protein IKK55_02455 [Clostridia bacterium]|nr:hypothetical protein [Clostridia bacterium]MBR6741173.1 hypothetical protein [Clostridia bacterium]
MNNNNFSDKQRKAIEQMKEMNARSAYKNEPEPAETPQSPPAPQTNSLFSGLNIPFLENLKTDGDLTLILGILLLLLSEKADKRLLFALIYILL